MSTGTAIIQRALQAIGADSIVSPADPDSIVLGFERLNSMLEMWLSIGIVIGFTPLKVPGDELNEPPDTRNGIIASLALQLAPYFDNGGVVASPVLERDARLGYANIKNLYQKIVIPNKVVSSTLPVGAGNRHGTGRRVFFTKGAALNG